MKEIVSNIMYVDQWGQLCFDHIGDQTTKIVVVTIGTFGEFKDLDDFVNLTKHTNIYFCGHSIYGNLWEREWCK